MTIEFGDWQLRPLGKGSRCWAVYARSDGSKRGWREFGRYYDSLGGALRFCAEYELRNGEGGHRRPDGCARPLRAHSARHRGCPCEA